METQTFLKLDPIKTRTGVALSARCNVFMPRDVSNRILMQEAGAQVRQSGVLRRLKGLALQALEFNADTVIVAVGSTTVAGNTGVPSSVVAADKLPDRPAALNEEVRGHGHALDTLKIRVGLPIKLIGKQLVHLWTPILPGWQADGVQHDQVNLNLRRAWAKIGRIQAGRGAVPALVPQGLLGLRGDAVSRSHPDFHLYAVLQFAGGQFGSESGAGSGQVALPQRCD